MAICPQPHLHSVVATLFAAAKRLHGAIAGMVPVAARPGPALYGGVSADSRQLRSAPLQPQASSVSHVPSADAAEHVSSAVGDEGHCSLHASLARGLRMAAACGDSGLFGDARAQRASRRSHAS